MLFYLPFAWKEKSKVYNIKKRDTASCTPLYLYEKLTLNR
ncbi:hypothetical protein IQ31_02480 [Sphingobacterium siyangense]|uniref:Uncharacterized protein n=1 Tax=Sphingobacterium siyangense TaxID=459529 RepID=A0A562MI05_9SPHI|nr:hypothetical protein IQ31_02480 [Sphingobacterium siyangense]